MRASTPEPHVLVARSVMALMQQEAARFAGLPARDHSQAIGGILAGKRIAGNRIAVVAASSPGPTPDNHQLGFSLDQAQGNAMLEQWYARDPDVDFIGLWHTHSTDLDQPTTDDVRVAQKLLLDPASGAGELLFSIAVVASDAPDIGWFYLGDTVTHGGEAYATVKYEALDDADPVFREPKVAVSAGAVADVVAEPPITALPATRQRHRGLVPALAGLLVVLLAGIALARVANRPDDSAGRDTAGGMVGTRVAMMTDTPRVTMPVDAATSAEPPETAPANTPTTAPALAATLPPEPSRPPSVVASQPPAPVDAGTPPGESATPQTPQPSPSRFPYALRFAPMDPVYRQDFRRRMRNLGCAGCYNVEIVGPTPFAAVRIRVAGSRLPPLQNYRLPSPVAFVPRAAPYILQVFDPQGKPLSEPVSVTVAEGELYVLELSVAGGA